MELQKLQRHWVIHNGLNRIKFQGKCNFKSIFLRKCLLEVHKKKGKTLEQGGHISHINTMHTFITARRAVVNPS